MLKPISKSITFYAFYTQNKQGKAGLTGAELPTVDIDGPDDAPLATAAPATEIRNGWYKYALAALSTANPGDYKATFKTTSAAVDQQWLPALWVVGGDWIEHCEAMEETVGNALTTYDPATGEDVEAAALAIVAAMPADAPAASAIREEMDANSTRLQAIDVQAAQLQFDEDGKVLSNATVDLDATGLATAAALEAVGRNVLALSGTTIDAPIPPMPAQLGRRQVKRSSFVSWPITDNNLNHVAGDQYRMVIRPLQPADAVPFFNEAVVPVGNLFDLEFTTPHALNHYYIGIERLRREDSRDEYIPLHEGVLEVVDDVVHPEHWAGTSGS